MHKVARLGEFWAWLPAFRAVAEAESLAVASRSLHLTPSALSRTVRLLEEAVGQPLFVREGRRLRLSRAGDALLGSVRSAMRTLDDGLAAMAERTWEGAFTIAAPSWFARRFVVPALDRLRVLHPGLVPVVQRDEGAQATAGLLRGELDLAISTACPADPRVALRALPSLPLTEYGLATGGVAGVIELDPPERLSGARARLGLDVAAEVCRESGLRVVLPRALAGDLPPYGPAPRGPLELWAALRLQPGLAADVAEAIAVEMRADG